MIDKDAYHACSKCRNSFPVTSAVRVWNSPQYLLNPFHGPKKQFTLFSYVRCPNCGHEEYDPSVRFLGVFPPSAILWLFLFFLILAIVQAIHDK